MKQFLLYTRGKLLGAVSAGLAVASIALHIWGIALGYETQVFLGGAAFFLGLELLFLIFSEEGPKRILPWEDFSPAALAKVLRLFGDTTRHSHYYYGEALELLRRYLRHGYLYGSAAHINRMHAALVRKDGRYAAIGPALYRKCGAMHAFCEQAVPLLEAGGDDPRLLEAPLDALLAAPLEEKAPLFRVRFSYIFTQIVLALCLIIIITQQYMINFMPHPPTGGAFKWLFIVTAAVPLLITILDRRGSR